MTNTDGKEQRMEVVRRKKIAKTTVSQHERSNEKYGNKRSSILRDSQMHGAAPSVGTPGKVLISMRSSTKAMHNSQLPSRCFLYPFAAVSSARYDTGNTADPESELKGTPWEDALLGQDSSKKRKFSGGQRSEEELQCIELLELFG